MKTFSVTSSVVLHIFTSKCQIWWKKLGEQEVRQKRDISNAEVRYFERRSKGWGGRKPILCFWHRPTLGHCTTCNGPSYIKNEYNIFYRKLDAEHFFRKKKYFRKKPWKSVWGHIWQFFRGRRSPATKIKVTFYHKLGTYWIFYYLAVFFKKAVFSEKRAKNNFKGQSPFGKGRGRLATKMNITFLMENEV